MKFKEFCSFHEGYVNPSQKVPEYFGGEIKWLRATDLNNSFVYSTSRKLTKKGYESAGKSALLFKPNTICISKSGTIGRIGILKDYMCGNRAVINIEINDSNMSTKYVFYWLMYKKDYIKDLAVGSVQRNLYISILENVEIKNRPLDEQRSIAKMLTSIDKKIEINKKMNKTLEKMAQAIYKNWFVDFVPFQESSFFESKLGMIPKNWKVVRIKDISKVVLGKTPTTRNEENYGNKYPFIKIPDMHDGMYVIETEKMLSEIGHKTQEKKLIPQNSISVSCIGTVGLVTLNSIPSHTNQQINTIVCDEELTEYIYFTMKLMKKKLIKMSGGGTTIGNINKGTFQKIKIIKPYDDVLLNFSKIVKPIFKKIKRNLQQNITLKTLRDTLLPKLMSGEIRVSLKELEEVK